MKSHNIISMKVYPTLSSKNHPKIKNNTNIEETPSKIAMSITLMMKI